MKFGIGRLVSLVIGSVIGILSFASNAFATPVVQDLWDAVTISTVQTQVLTLLTAMVTIRLAFLVYKYVKRVMGAS